eukprot:jgi/Mesen1/10705/ME000090S10169
MCLTNLVRRNHGASRFCLRSLSFGNGPLQLSYPRHEGVLRRAYTGVSAKPVPGKNTGAVKENLTSTSNAGDKPVEHVAPAKASPLSPSQPGLTAGQASVKASAAPLVPGQGGRPPAPPPPPHQKPPSPRRSLATPIFGAAIVAAGAGAAYYWWMSELARIGPGPIKPHEVGSNEQGQKPLANSDQRSELDGSSKQVQEEIISVVAVGSAQNSPQEHVYRPTVTMANSRDGEEEEAIQPAGTYPAHSSGGSDEDSGMMHDSVSIVITNTTAPASKEAPSKTVANSPEPYGQADDEFVIRQGDVAAPNKEDAREENGASRENQFVGNADQDIVAARLIQLEGSDPGAIQSLVEAIKGSSEDVEGGDSEEDGADVLVEVDTPMAAALIGLDETVQAVRAAVIEADENSRESIEAKEAARRTLEVAEEAAKRVAESGVDITPAVLTQLAHEEAVFSAELRRDEMRKQQDQPGWEGEGEGDGEDEDETPSGWEEKQRLEREQREKAMGPSAAEKLTANETETLALIYEGMHEAMARQADTDSRMLKAIVDRLKEEHRQELNDARAEAVRHAQMEDKLRHELERKEAEHRAAFREQLHKDEERRLRDLKAKKEEMEDALAAAELLGQSAFAFEDALLRGAPLEREAAVLQASVGGPGADALVDVVVQSLPLDVIKGGVPTRVQLQQELIGARALLKELSLIPPEGGGVFAHALAKMVAYLKVSERGTSLEGGGADAALARAEALLAAGDLLAAATALELGVAGSKAEAAAAAWAKEARMRAAAEQALCLVRAHATCLAAGLS